MHLDSLFNGPTKTLVNYRFVKDRFEADKVLNRAVLISGVGSAQIAVTITREATDATLNRASYPFDACSLRGLRVVSYARDVTARTSPPAANAIAGIIRLRLPPGQESSASKALRTRPGRPSGKNSSASFKSRAIG